MKAAPSQVGVPTHPHAGVLGPALIASSAGAFTALVARTFVGLPTAAETLGGQLVVRVPLPIFEWLLGTFGGSAKHLYFAIALVAEALLTALVGTALWHASRRLVRHAPSGVVEVGATLVGLVIALWLVAAGAIAPLLGGGPFGAALPGGAGVLFVALAVPDTVFAALLLWQLRPRQAAAAADRASDPPSATLPRRRLLWQGVLALGALAGGSAVWQFLSGAWAGLGSGGASRYPLSLSGMTRRIVPPPVPVYRDFSLAAGQTPEVTPTAQFYYVSKNLAGDPALDARTWQLRIAGAVATPFSLTYDDLRALPTVERYQTLECISNDIGGPLMSNARWRGTRLAGLLQRAGIQPGSAAMIFRGADGYSDSLHLAQALDPESLVVYAINGQPLPQAHGYPARLLVPGLYGMKNGKWLTELEVTTGGYTGYWEQQGWTAEALVKPMGRIDLPHDGDLLLAGQRLIAGVAFSGAAGIAEVQVSVDGGATWQPAELRRPLGSLTWVLWQMPWQATTGSHILAVRCVTLDGSVQTSALASPLPDGASGYDAVGVTVR